MSTDASALVGSLSEMDASSSDSQSVSLVLSPSGRPRRRRGRSSTPWSCPQGPRGGRPTGLRPDCGVVLANRIAIAISVVAPVGRLDCPPCVSVKGAVPDARRRECWTRDEERVESCVVTAPCFRENGSTVRLCCDLGPNALPPIPTAARRDLLFARLDRSKWGSVRGGADRGSLSGAGTFRTQ